MATTHAALTPTLTCYLPREVHGQYPLSNVPMEQVAATIRTHRRQLLPFPLSRREAGRKLTERLEMPVTPGSSIVSVAFTARDYNRPVTGYWLALAPEEQSLNALDGNSILQLRAFECDRIPRRDPCSEIFKQLRAPIQPGCAVIYMAGNIGVKEHEMFDAITSLYRR